MSLQFFLAAVIVVVSIAVILRESKERVAQYLAIVTLALGILQMLHSRGRLVRYLMRLQETGTFLAFATFILGFILFVRLRDKTFPAILVFAGLLLLLVDMKVLKRL